MELFFSSGIVLDNVTISGNIASVQAGAVFCSESENISISNTVIYNNGSQSIYFNPVDGQNALSFAYSNIQGGQDSIGVNDNGTVNWGDGNIDVDPRFILSLIHI